MFNYAVTIQHLVILARGWLESSVRDDKDPMRDELHAIHGSWLPASMRE